MKTSVPGPAAASRGLDLLDEDRANSMTDEGGPSQPERVADSKPEEPER